MGWDGTPYPPDFDLIFEFTETVPFIFSVFVLEKIIFLKVFTVNSWRAAPTEWRTFAAKMRPSS